MYLLSEKSLRLFKTVVLPLVAPIICCALFIASASADSLHNDGLLIGKNQNMTDPIVVMETNKGTIKVELFVSKAPTTANNFLDLVKRGFYNGLGFHRYEPGFVIQGGDPKGNGTGGFIDPGTRQERTIPLEVSPGLKHDEGVIAMARSNDPNSASSQFYFTLKPAHFLDMNYAVFGKVVDGMDVVHALRAGDKMTKVSVLEPAAKS